jgi:hypothetical protein
MRFARLWIIALLLLPLLCACSKPEPVPASPRPQLPQTIRFQAPQRSVQYLPGASELKISLGDITGGQVRVAIIARDGQTVHPATRMVAGSQIRFSLGADRFSLSLQMIENHLIGTDRAHFTLDINSSPIHNQQVGNIIAPHTGC